MSMRTWLLIDSMCLLHRARHTTGRLEFGGNPTGVTYGFLRQVKALQSRFQTRCVAFAFEGRGSLRREVCKAYKAKRKPEPRFCGNCQDLLRRGTMTLEQCDSCREADHADAITYAAFKKQVRALREEHLPALGHHNVFWEDGFEADDVLASLVLHSLREGDEAVIVSSDHDLYQLIDGSRVSLWLPHKKERYDAVNLYDQYRIRPAYWPQVMALAGCSGDGVVGMTGVGIKTAIKFFTGTLSAKKTDKIGPGVAAMLLRNLPLVSLPFPGCPTFWLREDDCTAGKWRAVCKQLGFDSLLGDW